MSDALEMMLRGGAATTFLLVSVFLLRDGGNRTLARLGALFCLTTGFWALTKPPFADWLSPVKPLLIPMAYGKAAAFWLFSRALFEDDFRMKPSHWAVLLGMMALGGAWYAAARTGSETQLLEVSHRSAQIVLTAAAIWVAWRGRGGDLVEPRRRARILFVVLSGLMMIGVSGSLVAPGDPPRLVTDLNVARIFVTSVFMALLVSGLRSEEMFSASTPTLALASTGHKESEGCVDPGEARLLTRLLRLMEEERVYREEGLTIGALASRAGAPEYALRRLINGRLGYRNFNAYLNGWRLADAKAALADPTQREVPISTIALDAGFSSLGPFNRAFKAAEGVTPSEFRDGRRRSEGGQTASPILKSA
jgi:AraC-like DNA-binding protein